MQPGYQAQAAGLMIGVTAERENVIRRRHQRLEHQFQRQAGIIIQAGNHRFGVALHLAQCLFAVKMLAADDEPYFIKQGGGLPVALAAEAIALLHKPLYCQSRQLL